RRNHLDKQVRFPVKHYLRCLAIREPGTPGAMNSNCVSTSSRLRVFLGSFLIVAASIAVEGAIGSSRSVIQRIEPDAPQAGKIAPWVIEHTVNGQEAELFVVLADQADLSRAAALATKNEKGRFVHDALWDKAQATQAPILQWLR